MANAKKILVVDDELPVLRSIARAMEKEGHDVSTAMSGEEAMALAKGTAFDVAVTDLMMPGMSGLELLRRFREQWPDLPVLMITGYPSVKAAVESIKAGAFDYLPKPFTPEELRGHVARAIARRGLRAAGLERAVTNSYCIPENSWMVVQEDGNVRIGAHPVLLATIGEVTALVLPGTGEMRYQGEPGAKLMDPLRRLHTLWTPVSGKVIATNDTLHRSLNDLRQDPYGRGWLLVMTPVSLADDISSLLPLSPGS